jgi:hypothetical protein
MTIVGETEAQSVIIMEDFIRNRKTKVVHVAGRTLGGGAWRIAETTMTRLFWDRFLRSGMHR